MARRIRKIYPEQPCEFCGQLFQPSRAWHRFCRPECRWDGWDASHPRTRTTQLERIEDRQHLAMAEMKT